jgi:maleamate amidohydrolase
MSGAQQPNGALPNSLNSSYLSSGFAPASSTKRALTFGPNPALIVIDICDAYLVPGSPLYAPGRFHSALKSCERLITTCRAAKIPIIFTRIVYSSPEDGGNWYKYKIPRALSCFDATNPLSDYPKESSIVRPQNGELVMSKQFSSSFFGTPLASQLKGIDTLIICGYSTSGCVRATAVDAIQYGFFPWVVKDA